MVQVSYPGVYIDEVSSGVRTITGVATSVTAFVGYTARGLDNRAKRIFSFSDFERAFGGLASDSELSYSVQQFYANGGGEAWIVRVPRPSAVAAAITLCDVDGNQVLTLAALSTGSWANGLYIDVTYDDIDSADTKAFNLFITDPASGTTEEFYEVTMDPNRTNFVEAILNDRDTGSQLVSAAVQNASEVRPLVTGTSGEDLDLTAIDTTADHQISVSLDLPVDPVLDVPVIVLTAGETLPTSVLGLCRLIEKRINAALGEVLDGIAVKCVPSASGAGIRLYADHSQALLPDTRDAQILVTEISAGTLAALGLTNATVNAAHYVLGTGRALDAQKDAVPGEDGTDLPGTAELIGSESAFTGIYALDKVDLINLLCIPDATRPRAGSPGSLDSNLSPVDIFSDALAYCKKRRAFLLVDPPPQVDDVDSAADWRSGDLGPIADRDAAAYFPRIRLSDPLNDFQLRTFAPCGVIAGLYSRTDATRGVWKAPAGVDAKLNDVRGLIYGLTDLENGVLNPLGLNCLRAFPIYGNIAWGARTLEGADAQASEWKYVPVRRLALFLEESLYRGTKWIVFEPNDEGLWAQIRLNLGAFMNSLFRQGAFQGKTPKEAYLVKCDAETTTQDDINRGIVNILVGFAPLKPAEFVIIKIQQLAGQIQT